MRIVSSENEDVRIGLPARGRVWQAAVIAGCVVGFWPGAVSAFQGASKAELAQEEKRAKAALDHAKRRVDEKQFGEALKLLIELHATYPATAADEEGQKLLPDVKKKANTAAEALVTEADKASKAKKYPDAEKKLKEVIDNYPNTDSVEKAQTRLKDVQKLASNERDAAAGLNLIRPWAADRNRHAAFRLQAAAIIKKYPETKAAMEAQKMVKELQ